MSLKSSRFYLTKFAEKKTSPYFPFQTGSLYFSATIIPMHICNLFIEDSDKFYIWSKTVLSLNDDVPR